MMSIKLTDKSKKCLRHFYLLPDSKAPAKECKHTAYNGKAKELLGESKENFSKESTTIMTSTGINKMHHLQAKLTNICAIIEAQFASDLFLLDIKMPAMFVFASSCALHITSSSMPAYLKKSNHSQKPLVLWVVQMTDQLIILLTHPLCHTQNTFLVAQDKVHQGIQPL